MVHWITPFRRSDVRGLEPLQREMGRLFDSLLADWAPAAVPGARVPAMDVTESPDAWTVRLEIPGIDPKDVQISVTGSELRIRGESRAEAESADETPYHRERRFGAFERSLTLPSNVAADQVKATCTNGVLDLVLPKKAEAKPRTIQVEVK